MSNFDEQRSKLNEAIETKREMSRALASAKGPLTSSYMEYFMFSFSFWRCNIERHDIFIFQLSFSFFSFFPFSRSLAATQADTPRWAWENVIPGASVSREASIVRSAKRAALGNGPCQCLF